MGNKKSRLKEDQCTDSAFPSLSVVKPKSEHKFTLIFLHGLGDTGHNWSRVLKDFLPPNCKLICPHAPVITVTMNGKAKSPAWFDIYGLHPDSQQDIAGMEESRRRVLSLVKSEQQLGISSDRIIIGGFSQGGALALFTAMTAGPEVNFAGILLLSSWLPLHKRFLADKTTCVCHRDVPLLVCHGENDPLIPAAFSQLSANLLQHHLGFSNLQLHMYPGMQHSTCAAEMKHVKAFLVEVTNSSSS